MPRATRAPIVPERTSPVPAVARPGLSSALTATSLAGDDDRVVALQDDDGAGASAASRAASSR